MQNCLFRVLMHGHNNYAMSASNCARIMRVMDACARVRVPVFEKVHVRMKRIHITCNGKYTENCWAASPKELAGLH